MTELKPCQFCGDEAYVVEAYGRNGACVFVVCISCEASGEPFDIGHDKEAINAWNTRAERTCEGCAIPNRDYGHAPSPCNFCARNDEERYDLYTPAKVVE